jgi:hypothetical protein
MVRYRTKPEQAARNRELVRAVYEELDRERPAGIRYRTVQLGDGVTFVHIAEIESDRNPLDDLEAFAAFQQDIAARCDEPPASAAFTEVGSYRPGGGSGAQEL